MTARVLRSELAQEPVGAAKVLPFEVVGAVGLIREAVIKVGAAAAAVGEYVRRGVIGWRATARSRPAMVTAGLLAAFAIIALVLHASGPRTAGAGQRDRRAGAAASGPPTPLPKVEPLIVAEITPDRARALNAATPLLAGELVAARPFAFQGGSVDRERALTCLASAEWYEAGDDAAGEQAVAQVVLNRLRHPAFPKTVCGVVFQGAERPTGCQFTFACDGALARQPSDAAWQRARTIAAQMLGGKVDSTVGTATHYHTDWVVPYWSGSLDKIAQVRTHLFFRWRGWWGERAAFSGRYAGGEQLDRRLIHLAGPDAAATLAADDPVASPGLDGVGQGANGGSVVRLVNETGNEFIVALGRKSFPGEYAVYAYSLCRKQPDCTVRGWIDPKTMPTSLPLKSVGLRGLSFLYRKSARIHFEQSLWNCRQVPREDASQCIPGTEAN